MKSENHGYIRLSRTFFKDIYWNQKRTYSLAEAWLDLIQMARFEATPESRILLNGRMITIKRGEIHASLRFLSERWKWGLGKTKRFIDKCKKNGQVEHRTEQGESVLKLCKYEYYNPLRNTDEHDKRNSGGTPMEQWRNKLNKENKENKEEERKREGKMANEFAHSHEPNSEFFFDFEEKKRKKVAQKKENESLTIEQRKMDFKQKIWEKAKNTKYAGEFDELRRFWEYYAEHGDSDKKMRFEKEKSFSIEYRLKKWFERIKPLNSRNYGSSKANYQKESFTDSELAESIKQGIQRGIDENGI